MATAIPFERVFQTATGTPVSGVKVYVYEPTTTTPRTAYSDTGLNVPIANPYIGDSAGYVAFYTSSDLGYRVVAKSANDSITYYDQEIPSTLEANDANDEIRLSDYAATQAGFVSAAEAAIAAGKWLNGEEIDVTLTSLMVITLTGPLRWRNVRLQKLTQSAANYEYAVTVNGPDFQNVTLLGANAAVGASSLTVASATNMTARGKYLLISNTIYNPDPGAYGNALANKSEWIRVNDTYSSGTTVPLGQALQTSYTTAANARMYRFSEDATVEWENVVITGGGGGLAQAAVRFNRVVVERFSNCGSQDNEFAAFVFNLCSFNSYITAWIRNSDLSGYGYGVELVGCDAPLVDWVWGENCRHTVTRGSSFTETLPFSGGSAIIMGRGGHTGMVAGVRSVGSVDDVHTGHIGHIIDSVTGDLVPGNAQEAITCESHAITYGKIRVTGADNPVTLLYYGHPADEQAAVVKVGSADLGYGGSGSNNALLAINRDAETGNAYHADVGSVEGRYPGGVNATATHGTVSLTIGKAVLHSRTTHTVNAVSSANGKAYITIANPWITEDSGNAAIYAVRADGSGWEGANTGQLGAVITLGPGVLSADNTAYYANDAQITRNGITGDGSESTVGIGTVFVPNQVKTVSVGSGSAVSLATATAANAASLSLDPGVWLLSGHTAFLPEATTSITEMISAINTVSATLPAPEAIGSARNQKRGAAFVPSTNAQSLTTGMAIVTLTATTTVYLVARATFTVAGLSAFGKLQAVRLS